MNKQIVIASLKFAPGLFKEFTLLGKYLSNCGFSLTYILSKKYQNIGKIDSGEVFYISTSSNPKEMIEDCLTAPWKLARSIKYIFDEISVDFTCVYNPHPLNYLILKKAYQVNPAGIRTIYLHEPYKPDKHLYGNFGSLYFQIVDFCQAIALKYANAVILPSPYAVELFKIRFPAFRGNLHLAPLLLPDTPAKSQLRKFFTIAGVMNAGKGLDTFCELIEYVASLDLPYHFRICTSSNIDSYLKGLSEPAKAITLIENPSSISDQQMFQVHGESKAFFLLHSTATQSGAMPVAFMHGTPVIARDIPAFSQFIEDSRNSCLVPQNCSSPDLLRAMQYVEANQSQLSLAARQTFEDTFSEHNWQKNYGWLIEQLTQQ